jgi:hypothetical protein
MARSRRYSWLLSSNPRIRVSHESLAKRESGNLRKYLARARWIRGHPKMFEARISNFIVDVPAR